MRFSKKSTLDRLIATSHALEATKHSISQLEDLPTTVDRAGYAMQWGFAGYVLGGYFVLPTGLVKYLIFSTTLAVMGAVFGHSIKIGVLYTRRGRLKNRLIRLKVKRDEQTDEKLNS